VSSFLLLGLMHGHWNVNTSDIDMIMDEDDDTEEINTGICNAAWKPTRASPAIPQNKRGYIESTERNGVGEIFVVRFVIHFTRPLPVMLGHRPVVFFVHPVFRVARPGRTQKIP
jgi:hypothetical protein